MHDAAINGNLAIATRLLEGGADLTLRTQNGKTALDYARKYEREYGDDDARSEGYSEVVALLSQPR